MSTPHEPYLTIPTNGSVRPCIANSFEAPVLPLKASPTPCLWRESLRNAAERVALCWVAHVVEAIFAFAILIAVLAAIFGALPDADLSGLFPQKSCCRGGE